MSFETDFPKLSKISDEWDCVEDAGFSIEEVEKFCLYKAKVKKVLREAFEKDDSSEGYIKSAVMIIREQLGLIGD